MSLRLLTFLTLFSVICAHYVIPGVYEKNGESSGDASGYEYSGDDGSGNELKNPYTRSADYVANDVEHDETADDNNLAIDMDCTHREDGLYKIAECSTQFLTCSGGISRIMDCPADLAYDERIEACDYPAAVPGCIEPPTTTEELTTTEEPATTEVTTEAEPVTDNLIRSSDVVVCKEDGYFSFGECSDRYYACTNGRSIPMTCPASLAFDESRQICDYPMAVAECQHDSNSGDVAQDNSYGNEVNEEGSGAVYEECNHGPTAIEPCFDKYMNCVNGQEAVFNCEDGQKFSQELSQCANAIELAECRELDGLSY